MIGRVPDDEADRGGRIGGIVGVELAPPDGLVVVCDGGPGGTRTRLAFGLGDLPAFLLQLQSAERLAVEQLGAPERQPFLSISRLELLRTEGVFALVLHMGQTRVPLRLPDRAARDLADALARWIPEGDARSSPKRLN